METSSANTYGPPVDQLLTYGELRIFMGDAWPDYLALGFGPEHVPDLIRMATDDDLGWIDEDEDEDEESLEAWAPIHARRTLGQLRAEAAIEPLFSLFTGLYQSDWVTEEIPEVFGLIGSVALPMLKATIADIATDEEICIDAISCVEKIGNRWSEARSACVAVLMEQLELFGVNDPEVNGFLVLSLLDLKAIEAASVIERAFAARCVDRMVMGDWDDAQVELGLKSAEEVQRKRVSRHPEARSLSPVGKLTAPEIPSKIKHEREAALKKTKGKMAKQSRKKNRKR